MAGASALDGASAVLAAEVCAPLLLLCWLCCWPDDASDTSSGKHPQKPSVITHEAGSHRRSTELFGRRFGSSAVSLHLPSTSGSTKQSLSAHKSHEDIRSRRKSQLEAAENDARYHSAPSVIDEVLHRRDWERSTKELYIPLKPDGDSVSFTRTITPDTDEHDEVPLSDEQIVSRSCKKHYTNIKSSRKKNAEASEDIKDYDATEAESSFYIGDNTPTIVTDDGNDRPQVFKPKETKQSLNESIRSKERMKQTLVPVEEFKVSRFEEAVIEVDRSGAIHHSVESRSSLYNSNGMPVPPPSVEAIGYESEASYPEEEGWQAGAPAVGPASVAPAAWGDGFVRARHASAGDVLAPVIRPQSGALSESDLDFDLEACDEMPPAYHEVRLTMDRKETAI
ncbi:uncharacterized protein LOC123703000 [Colias croceus]|uniref:uncharacterized protein LOC123703000 n=1 Tax=Colias crocea TaxID=72248 RepID=UPI001E280892|nr:uncharacterized protein LOC123703000 [Colias croceus]